MSLEGAASTVRLATSTTLEGKLGEQETTHPNLQSREKIRTRELKDKISSRGKK